MSVLIKGAKIPTRCKFCFAYDDYTEQCNLSTVNTNEKERPSDCPLTEIDEEKIK